MVQHQHRRIPKIKVSKESMNEINLLPPSRVMSAVGPKRREIDVRDHVGN
jgi:hypothetical protein